MAGQVALTTQVAAVLHRYRLRGAALFLLDMGHPATFLGSQFLWLAQPALGLVWEREAVGGLARLLEDETAVSALKNELAQKTGSGFEDG